MTNWLKALSSKQKKLFFLLLIIMILIPVLSVLLQKKEAKKNISVFTVKNTLKEIAPKMGVTPKNLARELGLKLSIAKNKPIDSFGIKQDNLNHALKHIASHSGSTIKYYIFFSLFLGAHFYLLYFGKPKNLHDNQLKKDTWYPAAFRIFFLVLSIVLCGVLLGKSPNPMEAMVKIFKSMAGLYPDPLVKVGIFFFFLFTIWFGNKIICGWACPFGSLQELLYTVPLPFEFIKNLRKKKISFFITNIVRSLLFIAMLLILFGAIGNKKGLVIYHYINPFNLFNLDFDSPIMLGSVIFFLVISIVTYRPFCRFICPFGLVGWLFEKKSLYSIKIDHTKCINCNACDKVCPLDAAKAKLIDKPLSSECYSCGKCLSVCPVDAISYCRKIDLKHSIDDNDSNK